MSGRKNSQNQQKRGSDPGKTPKTPRKSRNNPYPIGEDSSDNSDTDMSSSPGSPKRQRTNDASSSGKALPRPATPPQPDWASFGLDPNAINAVALASHSNFRQVLSEDASLNVPPPARNITSSVPESFFAQPSAPLSKNLDPPINPSSSKNVNFSNHISELVALLEAYNLHYNDLAPLIVGYTDPELRALILGIKFCFRYTMRAKDDNYYSIANNLRLLQSQQSNIEQEIKNLRANMGTPSNILKSIEKKIEDGFNNVQKKIEKPILSKSPAPEPMSGVASTSGMSKISLPSSTLSARPPVVLSSGNPSTEENALMLKKDKDSLIKRGLNQDLAVKIAAILASRDPSVLAYQTPIIEKLKVNYDLTELNTNQKFLASINKIYNKIKN